MTTETDLYVSWAAINYGWNVESAFRTAVRLDGKVVETYRTKSLGEMYYVYASSLIGRLPAGTHVIKLDVDCYDEIDESNEGNNVYTKTITIMEPSDYKIVFEPGEENSAGAMSYQSVGVGRVAKLNPCAFAAPAGKRFAGWRRKGDGRHYDDGMLVFNLASEPGAVVVLEAVWEELPK